MKLGVLSAKFAVNISTAKPPASSRYISLDSKTWKPDKTGTSTLAHVHFLPTPASEYSGRTSRELTRAAFTKHSGLTSNSAACQMQAPVRVKHQGVRVAAGTVTTPDSLPGQEPWQRLMRRVTPSRRRSVLSPASKPIARGSGSVYDDPGWSTSRKFG